MDIKEILIRSNILRYLQYSKFQLKTIKNIIYKI
jgi:hypothetical protein